MLGNLAPMWLPLALAAGTALLLVVDLVLPARGPRGPAWGAPALVAGLLAATFAVRRDGEVLGAWVADDFTLFVQRVVLVGALASLVGGAAWVARAWPRRQVEYQVLVLASLLGMVLLPGARDLVLLVTCFELMGIPLYLLAAFGKTDSGPGAAEGALKLYVTGAASSAITLLGLALVTGLAGGTSLAALASAPASPLLSAGLLLVLAGMGFKIGVAPFHAWLPDTYQGASTPFVSFLAAAPKVTGFTAIILVFAQALQAHRAAWLPPLVVLAFVTMVVGNLLAIPQTDVKRLLAYSGVAHAGYVLLGIASASVLGVQMTLFYLAAYTVTNAGAFLVAHAVASHDGDESVGGFDGLARRTPWLALALLVFVLSLAGIPFVAGFWAKLNVFIAAWEAGLQWLVVAGAVLSVVGLFYYLGLAKAAYVQEPPREERVAVPWPLAAAIIGCLLAVVAMGLVPRPIVDSAAHAASALTAR